MKHVQIPTDLTITHKLTIAALLIVCLCAALGAIIWGNGASDPCFTDTMRLLSCHY